MKLFKKKCAYCEKSVISKFPSRLKKRKYCSFICYSEAETGEIRVPRIKKECFYCGKLIQYSSCPIEVKRRKYCSRACSGLNTRNRTPDKNPAWKGGKVRQRGYILIRAINHPCHINGYVQEHRLVMEKHLDRYLTGEEIVHHKNGIKDDNRIKNLQVMTTSEHTKHHKMWEQRWDY